jgi:hypothetical protein
VNCVKTPPGREEGPAVCARSVVAVEAGARLESGVEQLALELVDKVARPPLHLLIAVEAPKVAAHASQPHTAAVDDRCRLNSDARGRAVDRQPADLRDADDAPSTKPRG